MATEAQIAANRANSLLSTGPRTPGGKDRSRRNALKHGLCSSVVLPEDLELVTGRISEFFEALNPQDQYKAWLVNQVAFVSIGVDRAGRVERRVRDKVCLRAELTWDVDRRFEAERLGAKLAGSPGEVSEALRRTLHGCDWLIGQWALLAHAADVHTSWTPDQTKLAFDLLGTPPQFREGSKPGTTLDSDGRVVAVADDPAAVARREIAALKDHREAVADLDEVERYLTASDLSSDTDAELRKHRRYEAGLHRRLRWLMAQLQSAPPFKPTREDLRPHWDMGTEAEPKTADEVAAEGWKPEMIHPPFDLEPGEFPEPGQVADVPAILESRKQKRLAKAESRREARRRKLDRLRA